MKGGKSGALLIACCIGMACPVAAATFTVTTNADSGAGSLRQAILDANAAGPGPHLIAFAIGSGPQTITLAAPLPALAAATTTINATTQPGFTQLPIVTLRGPASGATVILDIQAAGATVRGLRILGRGTAIRVGAPDVTIVRNLITGGLVDNVLLTHDIGVLCTGACANLTVGSAAPQDRNIISGSREAGVAIRAGRAVISGNGFGLNDAGNNSGNANEVAVEITGLAASGSLVGGSLARANQINRSRRTSVIVTNALDVEVSQNVFELNRRGIDFIDVSSGRILGNRFDFTEEASIAIAGTGSGNVIRLNQVRGGGSYPRTIGIDLGNDSVTPNDVLDADTGPNQLQNFPDLTSAVRDVMTSNVVHVTGTLHSHPNTQFLIDFYNSNKCYAIAHGPAFDWVGATTVLTDASGDAVFALPVTSSQSGVFTATATNLTTGDTSELSQCQTSTLPGYGGLISFGPTIDQYVVNENEQSLTLWIFREHGSTGAASVMWSIPPPQFSSDAQPGLDYVPVSGTVQWPDGDADPKPITIPLIDDSLIEGLEHFTVTLSSVSGAPLTAPTRAHVQLASDDQAAGDAIPTATEWGLLAMALMLAIAGAVALRR